MERLNLWTSIVLNLCCMIRKRKSTVNGGTVCLPMDRYGLPKRTSMPD